MVGSHILKGVSADGTLGDSVHLHILNFIAGLGRDRKGLASSIIDLYFTRG